jgi:hypothetical protein
VDAADLARYARHIALPEIGPAGQARICAARVGVIGHDLAAETAALYLRAAGCRVVEEELSLSDVDLIVRSGFDDTPLDAEAARLGLAVIAVRATSDAVDMVSFSGRVPSPAAQAVPFQAAGTPSTDDASAVLAGTLAAAEALQLIVRESSGPFSPRIRHMRLPLDGREPVVQTIGSAT